MLMTADKKRPKSDLYRQKSALSTLQSAFLWAQSLSINPLECDKHSEPNYT